MNRWYSEVMEAMQPMEELGGPDTEEYVRTMYAIIDSAKTRVINAINVAKDKTADPQLNNLYLLLKQYPVNDEHCKMIISTIVKRKGELSIKKIVE